MSRILSNLSGFRKLIMASGDGKSTPEKAKEKAADVKAKMSASTAQAGQNAKQFLAKLGQTIEGQSSVKQLAAGAAGGWITGIITHRVGKTAGLTIGGSILLIAAADSTGVITINWDKVGQNVQKITGKAGAIQQRQVSSLEHVRKYARTNTYFAAGFLGGFLLGLCT